MCNFGLLTRENTIKATTLFFLDEISVSAGGYQSSFSQFFGFWRNSNEIWCLGAARVAQELGPKCHTFVTVIRCWPLV